MSESCTIVIAAADRLPALKERTAAVNGEVLAFRDLDALRALEAIVTRRPRVVALERVFAATPRGVALINRIKADPSLAGSEIEIISHDAGMSIVRPPAPAGAAATDAPAPSAAEASAPTAVLTEPAAAPLDQRGTRRARRHRMQQPLDITVDGSPATLLDLSTLGAQVLATTALKPNQRVRLALTDDAGVLRITGSVAWASFEISKGGARYRAGIEFVKPDETAIDAFAERHK